jgi:iron complex transport system substrate-binding protein
MRIATLLPSATEIVCALGGAHEIVAVTHECDHPPEIRNRPVAVRSIVDAARTSGEIDAQVSATLRRGESLYRIDADVLAAVRPELLITQDLCEVCALPGTDVDAVLATLPGPPRVLRLHPHTLHDILDDILRVGAAVRRDAQARRLVARLRERIARVDAAVRGWDADRPARGRPRVFCMEWLDPPFCGGHWMPELVHLAGGREVIGQASRPSVRVGWSRIAQAAPEVVVLALCGMDVARTQREVAAIASSVEWQALPAVRNGRVYATDASAYFSRSGPRIVDGLEILAAMLHPEVVTWPLPAGSWARLDAPGVPSR